MAKSQKEKLEDKLARAEKAGDPGLVKAIKEELAALAKADVKPEAAQPEVEVEAPAKAEDSSDVLRKEVVALVRAQGPNPLKRFRVVRLGNGYVVVNPNEQAVSPLNPPLEEGEANKIASRFNASVKPPKDALKKAGSTGTIGEQ